jgi:hypothetical protein
VRPSPIGTLKDRGAMFKLSTSSRHDECDYEEEKEEEDTILL